MIIAKRGKYELCLPTYLGDHEYMTHDLEICKRESEHNTRYTIANFNENGDIISRGRSLLREMVDYEDIEAIRDLSDIADLIIGSENVPNEYGKMKTIKITSYNNGEEKTSIYKKPTDQDLEIWRSIKYDDCESQYFYSKASAENYLTNGSDDYITHECDGYFTIEMGDEEIGEYSKLEIKL